LGYAILESHNATFLDAREAIKNEVDPSNLPGTWQFFLPDLGRMSNRQEEQSGSIAEFFQSNFDGHPEYGQNARYPLRLDIVGVTKHNFDAPAKC
jgi:hypothetical protein